MIRCRHRSVDKIKKQGQKVSTLNITIHFLAGFLSRISVPERGRLAGVDALSTLLSTPLAFNDGVFYSQNVDAFLRHVSTVYTSTLAYKLACRAVLGVDTKMSTLGTVFTPLLWEVTVCQ